MSERVVIVQSGFLGDAVLASGMLRSLYSSAVQAGVGLVVRAEFAELFTGHPALARVHRFDKRRKGGTAALIKELRETGYDTALMPHRSFRSAFALRKAGIPRRVGFRQSDAPWLLTDRVEYDISLHETARNAMLLQHAGIGTAGQEPRGWLVPDSDAVARMRDRMGDARVIVISPGSVWPTKRWTVEGYGGLVRDLAERGYRPVLAGSSNERQLCETIAMHAALKREYILCGELSLAELLALISIARRVVTNDSAPLHLAESVGTPVTAIFGPTVPEFGFGPCGDESAVVETIGLQCRPCTIHGSTRCPIGTHVCMTSITVEQVVRRGIEDLRLTIDD